jgi:hypothetical protein
MASSLVYSHIYVYRTVMSLLYGGRYHARFQDITRLIGPDTQSVCDLCFGDTWLADWCRSHGIRWTGVDLSPNFCARARNKGFDVIQGDLLALDLPPADVFIMAGSLYHFHDRLSQLFEAVFQRTGRLILSEPVRNLSSRRGVIGWWAKRSANPGNRPATFRYDAGTLLEALKRQQARHGFAFRTISSDRDMLIELERPRQALSMSHVC